MYADYTFYAETFYGAAIAEADFPRLSTRASDFIDYYTLGRAAKVQEDETATLAALGKACCAIAEQMQTDENNRLIAAKAQAAALASDTGEIKSESVGSWSATYATAGDYMGQNAADDAQKAANAAYASIAVQYLANTGLLYRGGCQC